MAQILPFVTNNRLPIPRPRRLRVAGLFAGIGGLELGLARAGHETVQLCEIEPGAQEVLREHFPDIPIHEDICTLSHLPSRLDLLVAGFPCQDLSQAGRTAGIEGDRSGLVEQVFRLLREQRVPLVLLENVPFMLQLAGGQAMKLLVERFEEQGYCWAYRVVDSLAFGLPQRRRRVLFLAALEEDPRHVLFADEASPMEITHHLGRACGFYWTEGTRGLGWAVDAVPTLKGGSALGIPSPPAIWLPDGRFVQPDIADAERLQGFPPHWTNPAERVTRRGHRWKLVGNAVTVDVAAWVGDSLAQPGRALPILKRRLAEGASWPVAAWGDSGARFAVDISEWPVAVQQSGLAEFLKFEPRLLSLKATSGFLSRAEKSSLRFPEGFMDSLRRYQRWLEGNQPPGVLLGHDPDTRASAASSRASSSAW